MARTFIVVWVIYAAVLAIFFLILVPLTSPAHSHDNWVSQGNYRNTKGESCCNGYDCKDGIQYSAAPAGWLLESGEFIPYEEGVLDINKKVVVPPMPGLSICRRYDGSRRCVFGIRPSF